MGARPARSSTATWSRRSMWPPATCSSPWNSLDHVPVTDSEYPVPSSGTFDYFHGNSIALTSDGNLLISARNTSAVYDVNRTTGAVIWELGGKHSSFTLAPSGQQWFCYQHQARRPEAKVITLFDDGGTGP